MKILLTNDDGIEAQGLALLAEALQGMGRITIIAPAGEKSASSHSLTLRDKITVEKLGNDRYAVDGTPTDCILLGIQGILEEPPDLVVSGINHGPNMGEDVTYSGTVAAAIEGTILGVPSIAVSSLQRKMTSREELAKITRGLLETIISERIPPGSLLNINIPDPSISPISGVKITKLGSRAYRNVLRPEPDEDGKIRYTIGGEEPIWKDDNGTDIAAVRQGCVSITPLHIDLTDYRAIVEMERWRFDF